MTRFGELHPDGSITNERDIPQSAMLACPHVILVPEHYRADNSCRCNDSTHKEMLAWGYVWEWLNDPTSAQDGPTYMGRWVAGDGDD